MEDINAKVEVLGVLLQDIYRDINITESDEKKVLQNVCTKIYKINNKEKFENNFYIFFYLFTGFLCA